MPDGRASLAEVFRHEAGRVDGDRVAPGDTVALLEAMKTESAVPCPVGGTVVRVVCEIGDIVAAGSPLLVVVTDD